MISKAGYTIAGVTFIALTVKFLLSDSFPGMPAMDIIAHILNYFMVAVTLIVVSVPEGLPMSVTLSLALSMNRMLKTNNLVRKMHACETMGATTVICTDKTGTLTQNQMQVYQTNFYNLKDQKLGEDELSNLIKEGISTNSTAFLDFSEEKVKTLGKPDGGRPFTLVERTTPKLSGIKRERYDPRSIDLLYGTEIYGYNRTITVTRQEGTLRERCSRNRTGQQ